MPPLFDVFEVRNRFAVWRYDCVLINLSLSLGRRYRVEIDINWSFNARYLLYVWCIGTYQSLSETLQLQNEQRMFRIPNLKE